MDILSIAREAPMSMGLWMARLDVLARQNRTKTEGNVESRKPGISSPVIFLVFSLGDFVALVRSRRETLTWPPPS
jgi:hypothetical protein